jgi:hypothetical protein
MTGRSGQTRAINPADEANMSYIIIVAPTVCVLLGLLTLRTLCGPEPGSQPPEDYLPTADRRKPAGRRKLKTK